MNFLLAGGLMIAGLAVAGLMAWLAYLLEKVIGQVGVICVLLTMAFGLCYLLVMKLP